MKTKKNSKFIKIFNYLKLLSRCKELEKILKNKDNLIDQLSTELNEYKNYLEHDELVARIKDLEYLSGLHHQRKREYLMEIKDLKVTITELESQIYKLKQEIKKEGDY